MITLQQLKINIEELLKLYPEWKDLPIISSSDDEGNSFQLIHNSLSPVQVDDINEYYLELIGCLGEPNSYDNEEFDSEDNYNEIISKKDINAICIN